MGSLTDQRRGSVRRTALTIAITIALVIGSVAVAGTMSDAVRARLGISGSSNAPTAAGFEARKHLKLTAKVLKGPLIPGVRRPLRVTITNPLKQRVAVTAVTVKAGKPKVRGCKPAWVKTTAFKATKKKKPIQVKPRSSAKVKLSITLKNLKTVNQDACKSTRIPLKLRATARQT